MKNLLYRTKSGRRKGSLGLVLDSDAAEVASDNGGAAAPAPADAVDDTTAGPPPVDGGDGAAPDDDDSESELADDDGISESSTALSIGTCWDGATIGDANTHSCSCSCTAGCRGSCTRYR